MAVGSLTLLCALIQNGWAQLPPVPNAPDIVNPATHQNGAEPLSQNETHPNAKRLASQVALALTTYSQTETAEQIARRLDFAGSEAKGLAATFHIPGAWSKGRIIYPQLGGLGASAASVMVVVEQMVGTSEGIRVFIRTLDVRLALSDGIWRFADLASIGGTLITEPAPPSPQALAVLNDPRIEMPDSARWDILSGSISQNLLAVMARLAERFPFGVVTLSQGHPYEVFGTDRQSDHTRGRAVDIYRLGDTLVIDGRTDGSAVHQTVQWLYQQPEIRQIGSPWALDGVGGKSFTDRLHQDHLHIAVAQ
ncbi:hypothetical protein V6617_02815 [Pelagibacterium nitratireducens]|uniref:Uncharacterized protein n=1 Tax=Pelagibacterium nitratireducens TaxID=1046114 RepID=A0ABZ2I4D3_9HYPH